MATKPRRIGLLPAAAALGLLCVVLAVSQQVAAAADPDVHGQQLLFVLVHGIGHGAWGWYKVLTFLHTYGHQACAIDLAGAGINKEIAPENITTVAQYTRPLTSFLENLPPEKRVILVGHSLGGGSIAYASELFSEKVAKAVYLAANSPTYGDTYFNSFAPETFSRLLDAHYLALNFPDGPDKPAASVSLNTALVRDFFYNESPEPDINLALTLLTNSPARLGDEVLPLTPHSFGTVPRYYIKTLADRGVIPSEQDYIVARNPALCVFPLPGADHAVFFSKPLQLALLLDRIASLAPRAPCDFVRRNSFSLP